MTDWERCTEAMQRDVAQIHATLAAPCPEGVNPLDWEIHKNDLRSSLTIPRLLGDALPHPPEPPQITMDDLTALYEQQMAINRDRWRAAMTEADGTTINLHGRDVLVRYLPDTDPDRVYFLDRAMLDDPLGFTTFKDGKVEWEWAAEGW